MKKMVDELRGAKRRLQSACEDAASKKREDLDRYAREFGNIRRRAEYDDEFATRRLQSASGRPANEDLEDVSDEDLAEMVKKAKDRAVSSGLPSQGGDEAAWNEWSRLGNEQQNRQIDKERRKKPGVNIDDPEP
jgi:hypothetical protein